MTKVIREAIQVLNNLREQEGATPEVVATWKQIHGEAANAVRHGALDGNDLAEVTRFGASLLISACDYPGAAGVCRDLLSDPGVAPLHPGHEIYCRFLLAYALFCDGRPDEALVECRRLLAEERRGHQTEAAVLLRAVLVEALLVCRLPPDEPAALSGVRDLVSEVLVRFNRSRQRRTAKAARTRQELVDLLVLSWPLSQANLPLYSANVDRASPFLRVCPRL